MIKVLRPAAAATALLWLLAACSGAGSGGSDDGEETQTVATKVVGQRTNTEPFTPSGTSTATAAYDPATELVVALWKTRVTIPAGALPAAATIELTLVPGGITTTPKHRPLSPLINFKATGADGAVVARGTVQKAFKVETLVDRIIVDRDLHVLVHVAPGTAAEARYAIQNKDVGLVGQDDGSRIVVLSMRDTDFGHAVTSSEGAIFPAGYAEFPGIPPDATNLAARTKDPTDEPSEAWLSWTPATGSTAGYVIATAYDGAEAPAYCPGGTTVAPAAIVSERTNFPTKLHLDEHAKKELDSGKVVSLRLCSVNGRVPPDVSEGVTVTFDLPDRAAATLSGTPTARSNATSLDVTVGGTGVTHYQYALRADTATCDGATYSDWIAVATKITEAIGGEGDKVLCVLGKKSDANVQREATKHTWVRDATPPGSFTIGAVASPTNDATPDFTWTAATEAASYDVLVATDAGCTTAAALIPGVTALGATAPTLAEGSYFVCVAALDEAGNRTPADNDGVPLELDLTAPVFTSLALANDALDGYVNLAEKSNATALAGPLVASGHASAQYVLVSQATACDGALTYGTMPASNSGAWGADGAYQVCVRLDDDAGNTSYGASPSLVLDDTVPVFGAVALAGDAVGGYLNLAERSNATDLATAATASGHDAIGYKLVTSATACSSVGSFDAAIPTSNIAGAFGADGAYKICARASDLAGNPPVYGTTAAFTLDTDPPAVTSVGATDPDGAYAATEVLHLALTLDEAVLLGGSAGAIQLALETGSTDRNAVYTGGAGTTTLSFEYTIQTGDTSADLNVHATAPQLLLGGDRTLRDAAGNPLGLDLSGATSLATNEDLVVDTTPPSAFNIATPSSGATISDNTPEITWSDPGDATSYDVKIDDASGCPTPAQSYAAVAGLSQAATLLGDGTWYVCVTARDAAGNTSAAGNDNLSFSVATGTWASMSGASAPTARYEHTTVWDTVHARMLVWGGYDGAYLDDGAAYDPAGNGWSAIDDADPQLPAARGQHTATWTGTKMVVWGGRDGTSELQSGGVYDPAGPDYWVATATGSAPSARRRHTAVWSGTRVLVWGGFDGANAVADGAAYDPSGDTWTALDASDPDLPAARQQHTAVWTGTYMIVWGGLDGGALQSGARYDPTGGGGSDYWLPMASTDAPAARYGHTAVWTGSRMVIYGGEGGSGPLASGAIYDPVLDDWTPMTTTDAVARVGHTAVWDTVNSRMLVWGGSDGAAPIAGGGAFHVGTNAWTVPALNGSGAPAARERAGAVWSGTKMVIFGGMDGSGERGDGGRYTP